VQGAKAVKDLVDESIAKREIAVVYSVSARRRRLIIELLLTLAHARTFNRGCDGGTIPALLTRSDPEKTVETE